MKKVINRDGLENNDNWKTPDWLYKLLDDEFHFDFDPCPLNHDITEWDGTLIEWGERNFCNPPYSKEWKPKFIQKAFDEWRKGKTCVLLVPAATGIKQFHELMLPNAEIRWVKGRIAFEGLNTKGEWVTDGKGKHDSMIVVFHKEGIYSGNKITVYDTNKKIKITQSKQILQNREVCY